MGQIVQQNFAINPDVGFVGQLARPTEPHSLDSGVIHVPAGTRNPRPGDALIYDRAENAFRLPVSTGEVQFTCGILTYRVDRVPDADLVLEFADGAEIEVGVHGTFWVSVGAAVEYGQLLQYDLADNDWTPYNGGISADVVNIEIADRAASTAFQAAYDMAEANTALTTALNTLVGDVNTAVNAALATAKAQITNAQRSCPITCVSRAAVSAGGIAQARIGFGRVL